MSFLGIFRLYLKKTVVILEISKFEFLIMKSFIQTQKYLNLGQKLLFWGIFGLEFEKVIVIFEISTPEFF